MRCSQPAEHDHAGYEGTGTNVAVRIHFTVEDLARTRIDASPWPLLETAFAVRRLQQPYRAPTPSLWRRQTRGNLSGQDRIMFDLTPATGYTPCFLATPAAGTIDDQLEAVRAVPHPRIHDDMTFFAARHPVPSWARRLADDPPTVQQVINVLGHIHAVTVAPYWPQLRDRAAADRAIRTRQILDNGIHQLLTCLHPIRIRWTPPVLHVRTLTNVDADVHLDGRGLLLVPSLFGPDAPTFTPDVDPQPVLTYPVPVGDPAQLLEDHTDGDCHPPAPVAALLGQTRAAVLHAIITRPGSTTSELAGAVGASLSTVSEHTTVLRTAGLIATARYRHTALHTATGTGTALYGQMAGSGP